jgi:uncharacterized protein YndB with AHSA1/START domain
MTPDQIERETLIAAPVERVWTVLTEAEHIGGWFADAGAEIDLRPGGALVMHWKEHGTAKARVEAVEPPHRFAYRWAAHHAAGEEPAEGNSTLVEFTLTPEGDGTRLRVLETGFATLATSDEQRRGNYDDNVGGWTQMVGRLAEYAQRVTV